MKSKKSQITNKEIVTWAFYGIMVFIILIVFFGIFYIIPAGHRGVLLTFGKPTMQSIGEGLHFKLPIIQSVVIMEVRTQKYESDLTAASKDLQDVATKIAINYHVAPESVPNIYTDIGIDYANRVIYPLEQESNKATTSKFTAEELITRREEVRSEMENILRDKLAPRGIVVESISIVDFKFSPSFSAAIEQKVTAEQNALAAKNKLEQIKYEADQRVAQAQGEAEALRLQKQQVTPELLQLKAIEVQSKSLDVQLEAIKKWNGISPSTLITGEQNSNVFPFFQIQGVNAVAKTQ